VNDVAAHFGGFLKTPLFDKTDSLRNILSNKLSALFRFEAKDLADIREIALHEKFNWQEIGDEASQKEAGLDLPLFAETLVTVRKQDYESILWIKQVPWEQFHADMEKIASDMLHCTNNTLAGGSNS
jgi:hypothetical protein